MPTPHALLITGRTEPGRLGALQQLCGGLPLVGPADVAPQTQIRAVVLDGADGSVGAGAVDLVRRLVAEGVGLLAFAPLPENEELTSLLGVSSLAPLPHGEVVATRVTGSPLVQGVADGLALADRFHPLEILAPDAQTLLEVSVHLRDRPALVGRRVGAGHVIACGLGATTAALGDPHLRRVLRRGLAHPARAPRREPFGVGLVGFGPLGGMGSWHGEALQRTDGLEFVAAVDPQPERRKAAETQFPRITAYGELDDLLRDDAVEVVVVATPPDSHAALATRALRAGRHVVVEKPLCLRAREADRLLAEAQRAGRTLTVHQNRRFDPDFLAVHRAVTGGRLGEVFNVETFVGGFAHPCRAWHSEVRVSGGAVYDWGSHHLDWIVLLMGGLPQRVETVAHKRVWHDVTNLDQVRVRLRWSDGREAEFVQSDIAAVRRPKFYVQGTAGTLVGHYRPVTIPALEPGRGYVEQHLHHAEAPATLELATYETGWGITTSALPLPQPQPDPFHRGLADHLHFGEPVVVDPVGVRDVVALLEAAQRSGDEGGRAIDPADL